MPAVGFILVPYDGGLEKRVNASEAQSMREVSDPVRETRLSELLGQRGMEDIRFKFTDSGVLMHGRQEQAMVVGRLVGDLSNLSPSELAQRSNTRHFEGANEARHVSTVFGDAARRFKVSSMRPEFRCAANDAPAAVPLHGRRPAISGSHLRLAA